MASHSLDNQLNERLITQVAEHDRQLREMKTLQLQGGDALGVFRSERYTSSLALSANSGGYLGFVVWLTDGDRPLFGIPEFTLYEDDATMSNDAKIIGSPLNAFMDHYKIVWWPNENESTDDAMFYWIYVFNTSASPHTVYLAARARWLVSGSTLTTF